MFGDITMILLPLIIIVAGGLVCLASEPFLKGDDKHIRLPWIGAITGIVALLVVWFLTGNGHLTGAIALDPIRRVLISAIIGAAIIAMGGLQQSLRRDSHPGGEAYALVLFSAAGAMLMVQAGTTLVLYVGLELASLSIYPMVALRRHRPEAGEGLMKYLVMGAVFSGLFLYGMALTYGATGTLAIGRAIDPVTVNYPLLLIGQLFMVIGLLFKVGAVPFHFWTPDAYQAAPLAVTGFMAAAMKVGAFAALGLLWIGLHGMALNMPLPLEALLAAPSASMDGAAAKVLFRLDTLLVFLAVLSLLVGSLTALGQTHLRRLMGYSAIANAGYLLLALKLGAGAYSLHGLWTYLAAYAIGSVGVLAAMAALSGPEDDDAIERFAGGGRRNPFIGIVVTLFLISLAGLPISAGFTGKFMVLADLVARGGILVAIVAMLLAVVAASYYLRVVFVLWSRDETQVAAPRAVSGLLVFVLVLAALATLALTALPLWLPDAVAPGSIG